MSSIYYECQLKDMAKPKKTKEGNHWKDEDVIDLITKHGEIPVHRRLESHSGLRESVARLQKVRTIKEVHVNKDYRYYALVQSRSKRS